MDYLLINPQALAALQDNSYWIIDAKINNISKDYGQALYIHSESLWAMHVLKNVAKKSNKKKICACSGSRIWRDPLADKLGKWECKTLVSDSLYWQISLHDDRWTWCWVHESDRATPVELRRQASDGYRQWMLWQQFANDSMLSHAMHHRVGSQCQPRQSIIKPQIFWPNEENSL